MGFREARIKAALSVLKAAELLGVSDAAIYQWETGVNKPTAKRLLEIAKLYGCSIDDLLKEESPDA